MTEPTGPQPADEQPKATQAQETDDASVPASIFTKREVPTRTRRMLWAVGFAVGAGYVLYGLWGMFTAG
ncbi:hypothetical protein [Tessaracoccus lacteus]|uniref:Uncharacterized protein n=1 Tax=Tessaracoccus lacteus TaxID=3041766 RepID=A0ABY8PWW6_9ACTN|nr:hypothetical protein [Tessaracoccus sp. T21]WGT46657.1 hypothetical protein QH948_10960 [Tessaracoccus sp. T21]